LSGETHTANREEVVRKVQKVHNVLNDHLGGKDPAMSSITAKELKDHPADVLGRVQYGRERVAVTRYGKEVAAVVPIEDARLLDRIEDLIDAEDALNAIEEAEREGTVGLGELRARLGLKQ
jgi:prevent-host-death family protein